MAEATSNGQPVEGTAMPHAQEVEVRARNARRIARRRQANALALQVNRVSGENLDRFGETRQVGGTFEEIEDVPDPVVPQSTGLNLGDLASFLQAFNIDPQQQLLGQNTFLSSFAPGVLGLNTPASDQGS